MDVVDDALFTAAQGDGRMASALRAEILDGGGQAAVSVHVGWQLQHLPRVERLLAVLDDLPEPVLVRLGDLLGRVTTAADNAFAPTLLPGAHGVAALLHVAAEQLQLRPTTGDWSDGPASPLTFAVLRRYAMAKGADPQELLPWLTADNGGRGRESAASRAVALLADFADVLSEHTDLARSWCTEGSARHRTARLHMLDRAHADTLAAIADSLVEAATARSAEVRTAAAPLVARVFAAASPGLLRLAQGRSVDRRLVALRLLAALGDASTRAVAVQLAEADATGSIRELPARWRAEWAAEEAEAAGGAEVEQRPAGAPIDWRVEVTPQLLARVDDVVEAVRQLRDGWQQTASSATGSPSEIARAGQLLAETLEPEPLRARLVATLTAGCPPDLTLEAPSELSSLAATLDGLPAEASLLLRGSLGLLWWRHGLRGGLWPLLDLTQGVTVSRLEDLLHDAGVAPGHLARDFPALIWQGADPALYADYARRHVAELIDEACDPLSFRSAYALRALAAVDPLPPTAVERLYAEALSTRKRSRGTARRLLRGHAERVTRAAAQLSAGSAELRLAAVEWLTELGDPAAIPALQQAVRRERADVVKGAMLDTLARLGVPVGETIDRAEAQRLAVKGLAKGWPADLDWLDPADLPPLRWADSGEPVPVETVAWWLLLAHRAKSPEPHELQRISWQLVDPTSADPWAQELLDRWIAHDTEPMDDESREQVVQRKLAEWTRYLWLGRRPSAQEIEAMVRQDVSHLLFRGSATASKGVLAAVAATGRSGIAERVTAYLTTHRLRTAQCKALLGVLAWSPDPDAVRTLLGVAVRYRQRPVQEEAIRLCAEVGERLGWSVDELADRTVPTGGFDDDGRLVLPIGGQLFAAQVTDKLALQLYAADGSRVRELPDLDGTDPRRDAEAVEARRLFGVAKSVLADVRRTQPGRLYEAMCLQRSWSLADWRELLAWHPLMRHLASRLVWLAWEGERLAEVFRTDLDGEVLDVDGEPVDLEPDCRITVAHAALLDADTVTSWAGVLLPALLDQLGRQVTHLPPGSGQALRLSVELLGPEMAPIATRFLAAAKRLGYRLGDVGDGPTIAEVERVLPGSGLRIVVEVEPVALYPADDERVTVLGLCVEQQDPDADDATAPMTGRRAGRRRYRLSEVPPVLLSEAVADLLVLTR
mgnify:CR=1 FL=1